VIKYSLAALGHFLSGDQVEKGMHEKETAKAFLLVQAPLPFAPVRRMCVGIPGYIRGNHFPICVKARFFIRNRQATLQVAAYPLPEPFTSNR